MVDLTVLPGYVAAILLFLGPPGPDMAYMLAVGLEGGRRSAVKAILGIGTGMSVYAAAVVAGMGEIARSHPLTLDAVRIMGAGGKGGAQGRKRCARHTLRLTSAIAVPATPSRRRRRSL
jgi:hypothetical protein